MVVCENSSGAGRARDSKLTARGAGRVGSGPDRFGRGARGRGWRGETGPGEGERREVRRGGAAQGPGAYLFEGVSGRTMRGETMRDPTQPGETMRDRNLAAPNRTPPTAPDEISTELYTACALFRACSGLVSEKLDADTSATH